VLSPYEQGFIAIIPLLESVKCDFEEISNRYYVSNMFLP
jgi:hypothetical protein